MSSDYSNISEMYNVLPRISSTYDRFTFDNIASLSSLIDFSRIDTAKHKRNRSMASVQAFIVELAIQDDHFIDSLREYFYDKDAHFSPVIFYKNIHK